jgi:molybdopterin biosynthesis enzyme
VRPFQIAIRPGRPFLFAEIESGGEVPVFGLPGNPVACLVAYHLLVRPAISIMAGRRVVSDSVGAVVDSAVRRRPDGKVHFLLASAAFGDDGRLHASPADGQRPHMLRSMANSNALIVLEDGEGVDAGSELELLPLDPSRLFGAR